MKQGKDVSITAVDGRCRNKKRLGDETDTTLEDNSVNLAIKSKA